MTRIAPQDPAPAGQSEAEMLRAQLQAARYSALLQAERSARLVHQRDEMHKAMSEVRGSIFWRATLPLRVLVELARPQSTRRTQIRMLRARVQEIAQEEGYRAILRRGAAYLRNRRRLSRRQAAPRDTMLGGAPTRDVNTFLAPNAVIIAELSIAACAKYRVWHKQRMLQSLGIPTQVVNWTDILGCEAAAMAATFVILYRVPAEAQILALLERLRAWRIPVWYDLDDLIFDRELYLRDRTVSALPSSAREGVLSGARLYRQAMLACDGAIASTPGLARAMQAAGMAKTLVVENAIDEETLALASEIGTPPHRGEIIRIVYGAGSRTHDGDFRQAAEGLLAVLRARPNVRLRIIGELTLPESFDAVDHQIERMGPSNFALYLQRLAECDISIAPLEASPFNDAKSNIKFLEAAVLGLPSVCSPADHFVHVLDGTNGMLAGDAKAWEDALLHLIDDAPARAAMGARARDFVMARYSSAAITQGGMRDLARLVGASMTLGLRVICVTSAFAPRHVRGGARAAQASICALAAQPGTGVVVVSMVDRFTNNFAMTRYEQDGIPVFAIPVLGDDPVLAFDNPVAEAQFAQVLEAVAPDIVLFFSIDGLGAGLMRRCAEHATPYAILADDPWYLCARTDMIREEGRFCGQRRVDMKTCTACMPLARHLSMRASLLLPALHGAACVFVPNDALARLYADNGVAPACLQLLPRGLPPAAAAAAPVAADAPLAIGFSGFPARGNGGEMLANACALLPAGATVLHMALEPDMPGETAQDIPYDFASPPVVHDAAGVRAFAAAVDVMLQLGEAPRGFDAARDAALADGAWLLCSAAQSLPHPGAGTVLDPQADAAALAAAILRLAERRAELRANRGQRKTPCPSHDAEGAALRSALTRLTTAAPARQRSL